MLMDYKARHGDANAPRTATIGLWLRRQKALQAQGRLDSRREKRLADIGVSKARSQLESVAGFERGSSLDDRWDANLAQLVQFKERHGHCSVPYDRSKQWGSLGLSPTKLQEESFSRPRQKGKNGCHWL